jgi:hypothetical protein
MPMTNELFAPVEAEVHPSTDARSPQRQRLLGSTLVATGFYLPERRARQGRVANLIAGCDIRRPGRRRSISATPPPDVRRAAAFNVDLSFTTHRQRSGRCRIGGSRRDEASQSPNPWHLRGDKAGES